MRLGAFVRTEVKPGRLVGCMCLEFCCETDLRSLNITEFATDREKELEASGSEGL